MIARRGMIGLLLGGAAALLGGCGLFGGNRYRYKMTVEVDTPQGLKSGFAVREVSYSKNLIKLPDMAAVVATQRGEAVAVDLPGVQVLLALLSVNGYETLQAAFGDDAPETLDAAKADARVVELKPKPGRIPEQSGYPMLVRFKDMHDPTSVELVSPDDLATSFGAGVSLRRITVQMVSGDVTVGIAERLSWLSKYPEPSLSANHSPTDFSLSAMLRHGNFRIRTDQ